MDDSASSLGPVTIELDSLASHNDVQSHHCRIVARYLQPCPWRFGEVGNAEEPRFGGALPRLRAFSLEGRPPPRLDIRKPASQALGEGALRSFYRRTAALGDTKADTIDWRWIVLAKWYRLAALGSPLS
jgi:hypothetical protein